MFAELPVVAFGFALAEGDFLRVEFLGAAFLARVTFDLGASLARFAFFVLGFDVFDLLRICRAY